MKHMWYVFVFTMCVAVTSEAQNRVSPPPVDMEALQKAMGAIQARAAAGAAQTVDFRKLKELLPEKLGDLKRTSAKGQKNAAMGITISEAEGKYTGPDDASAVVELSDTAGMGGLGAFAQMALAGDIDSESDTGYEKTYTHQGLRVMEQYDSENRSGEISTMVEGRFMVKISMQNIKPEQLKAALSAVDFKKLAALKAQTGNP
ncbi:MAG: hypothetical protein KBA51_00935 [Kiritimatiellae bacterium]|nr:hypothetical protein [Kiritimatiellia bacterium]